MNKTHTHQGLGDDCPRSWPGENFNLSGCVNQDIPGSRRPLKGVILGQFWRFPTTEKAQCLLIQDSNNLCTLPNTVLSCPKVTYSQELAPGPSFMLLRRTGTARLLTRIRGNCDDYRNTALPRRHDALWGNTLFLRDKDEEWRACKMYLNNYTFRNRETWGWGTGQCLLFCFVL